MTSCKTITILPETAGGALCLSMTGNVTAEDFTACFEKPLRDIIKKYGFYNLYVSYDENFLGWTEEAADLSFKCITACSPMARRAAYVNAPDSRRLLMKMVQPLSNLEVRYFDHGQEQEAFAWVKELATPAPMALLPDTDDKTVCVRLTGVVAVDDFITYFEKPFRERMDKQGYCNVLVLYDADFQGWTEEAANVNFKYILTIAPHVKKVAYINAPDSRRLLMSMLRPLGDGELRYFESGEEQEAVRWIKS